MWEPLPLIVYGYAIHPLSPSRRDTYSAARNRLSTVTEASADENTFSNVVNLEVGDEVYAFEKYTPSPREPVDGIWYRGCVIHQRQTRPSGIDSFYILKLRCLHHSPPTSCMVVVLRRVQSTPAGPVRGVAASLHWDLPPFAYLYPGRAYRRRGPTPRAAQDPERRRQYHQQSEQWVWS